MSRLPIEITRVLAIDPASRGLGFALIEDPSALIDWGFRNTRNNRDVRCLAHLISMLTKFKPDVLVLEDFETLNRRRPASVRALVNAFAAAAKEHGIDCRRIPREAVRPMFSSCRTRYDIALELAARFPEIKPWCPPKRKIWMTEDPRMNIFDALSFAVTHLAGAEDGSGPSAKAKSK